MLGKDVTWIKTNTAGINDKGFKELAQSDNSKR